MAVNILLSYAFHGRTNLADVRRDLVCGRLMIDSGAFTADSTGKPIKLADYAAYLRQWEGCWDTAVTLDVIGDPAASRVNTRKLHDMGLPVMPVFTRGERVEEFDAMVRECGYVCVGGGVGMPPDVVAKRAALLQRRAQDLGGGIHALGLGSVRNLARVKPFSADASNIASGFVYGRVFFFDGEQIKSVHVAQEAKHVTGRYRKHLLAHGIDVGQIAATRRLPKKEGRTLLMRAASLGIATADEYLKPRTKAPVPSGVTDTPGTHFYSAVPTIDLLRPSAALDRELHEGFNPPVWTAHGWRHTHHPRYLKAAS